MSNAIARLNYHQKVRIMQTPKLKIPLMKPYVGTEEIEEIKKVLESGYLAQGPKVKEFESKFAEYIGVKHAIATSSCTTALELALRSIGAKANDEVIVPDFTFPATGNIVFHVNAKPVLVDVDSSSYNIDPEGVKKAISKRTKAIIVVHLFGHSAEMGPLLEIAEKCGCYIIEDAACGLGASYEGKQIGTLGNIACFSFHPRKILTTGEGGMLVTNDDRLAEKAATLKDHGKQTKRDKSQFVHPGYNFRMSDVLAAIGVAQLAKFDRMLKMRRELAEKYTKMLIKLNFGIKPPYEAPWTKHTYQSYVTYVTPNYRNSRDECISILKNKYGIETQIGTYALHMQPAYSKINSVNKARLERSKNLYLRTLTLPLYHTMSGTEQEYVINALKNLK
jgi:perosamine synthetase